MIFFYLVTVYGAIANEIVKRDGIDGKIVPPMTCLGGTVDPDYPERERYCPVSDEYHMYISFVHVMCPYHIMLILCSCHLLLYITSSLKTRFYIYFNVFYALSLYFVLGCLEMQHVLSKIWETGLVLGNYKGVIDLICEPILSAGSKPKALDEMKVKRAEGLKTYQLTKQLRDSQKSCDVSINASAQSAGDVI